MKAKRQIVGPAQWLICDALGLPGDAEFDEILNQIEALKAKPQRKPRGVKHSIIEFSPTMPDPDFKEKEIA